MSNSSEPQHVGSTPSTSPAVDSHALDPHALGSHMLGSHVVGHRVVVRRLVPGETGPTGGPAFTDVLGVCRSWGSGLCEIERADGTVVAIRLADIVSGKPVPPRPSVRHRVGVRAAELHTTSLWPGLETSPLGEWLLRSDPSPTGRLVKRANSALALGDPTPGGGEDLDRAIVAVREFYTARERPVLIHTEIGSATEAGLLERGWHHVEGADSHFMLASTARALRAASRLKEASPGEETVLDEEGTRVCLRIGAARGAAALDGDWLGLHRLHVDGAQRRLGLGTATVAGLLEWGAQRGATTAWLHVEVDNTIAQALYERLHFAVHHEMTYLREPA